MNTGDVSGPRWVSGEGDLSARLAKAEAERDALRAQLDSMTVEYQARIDTYRSADAGWDEVDTRTARYIRENAEMYPHHYVQQRLVGPWVDVTD